MIARSQRIATLEPKLRAGLCRRLPDAWFTSHQKPEEVKEGEPLSPKETIRQLAVAIGACGQCVVKPECLERAILEDASTGVAGGLTERERVRITKRGKLELARGFWKAFATERAKAFGVTDPRMLERLEQLVPAVRRVVSAHLSR